MQEDKCPYCETGIIEEVEWGEYPGQSDVWCSNDNCIFNEDPKDRAEERRSDELERLYY